MNAINDALLHGSHPKGKRPLECLHALAFSLLVFAVLVGVLFALPCKAHAKFNETADSFPAMQDLGDYGGPIYGDQLPDGTYKIGARTSSRMCVMYTNPSDAEARDSKEQAVLSVSGGSLTVLFYISSAYTHLYFGTQEEAASLTNEDGTDASAYIAGDPDDGYVPHLFALSIGALNSPMTISTYSGGDHGWENGKWYTRTVVFTMTDEELQEAIAGNQEPEQSAESEGGSQAGSSDEQDGQNGGQGVGGSGTTGTTQGAQEAKSIWIKGSEEGLTFTFKRSEDDENTFSLFEDAFVDNQKLPQSAYTAQAGSLILTLLPTYLETVDVGDHVVEVTFADGVSAAVEFSVQEKTVDEANVASGVRGVLLNGSNAKPPAPEAATAQNEAPAETARQFLTPQLIAAIVVALLFFGGLGWRFMRFSQSYEKGEKESPGC